MAKIEFVMDDIAADVEPGTRLLDVAKESGSSIPFGCTNGVCGTCIIKILAGQENISKPEAREAQSLEMFGADDGDHRLACQCYVHGDIELENP